MKKIIFVLLAALLLGCACGCADYLDAEYKTTTAHVKKEDNNKLNETPDAEIFIQSGDVDSLTDAVIDLIRARDEYGIIRIASYNGDINVDAEEVCLSAAYESAYGAYAVYYVSFAVNNYVPYSEVKVYFTYKDNIKDDKYISAVADEEEARGRLETALRQYDSELVFFTSAQGVNTDFMQECIEELYFSGSGWLPVMPGITATSYPEEGDERIVELKFSYPYSNYRMNTMREKTENAMTELISRLEGMSEREALTTLCRILSEECEYVGYSATSGEYDRRTDKYTAYGALALGRASGEGYAMAVQLICRELGIESMVVLGRHENVAHAWNIVRIDGEYYHVDASLMAEKGEYNTFMLSDDRFASSYFWDLDKYPACTVDRLAGQEPVVPDEQPQPDDEPVEDGNEGETGNGEGSEESTGGVYEESDETGDGGAQSVLTEQGEAAVSDVPGAAPQTE